MDEGQQPERLSAQGHLVQLTESIWLSCRWLYGPLRILRGKNCWFIMHLRQRLINMLARFCLVPVLCSTIVDNVRIAFKFVLMRSSTRLMSCYCWNVSWFEIQLLFFFFSTLLKQNVWRTSSSSIIDILQIHSRVDQLHSYPKILYVPRVYIGR